MIIYSIIITILFIIVFFIMFALYDEAKDNADKYFNNFCDLKEKYKTLEHEKVKQELELERLARLKNRLEKQIAEMKNSSFIHVECERPDLKVLYSNICVQKEVEYESKLTEEKVKDILAKELSKQIIDCMEYKVEEDCMRMETIHKARLRVLVKGE